MAELSPEDRATRRDAVGELGSALRELVDAAVRTEVPIPELAEAAAAARELATLLRGQSRELHEIASVDDPQIGERWYSPVYGPGNPVTQVNRGFPSGTCVLVFCVHVVPLYV